jgi:hypothetical protein
MRHLKTISSSLIAAPDGDAGSAGLDCGEPPRQPSTDRMADTLKVPAPLPEKIQVV